MANSDDVLTRAENHDGLRYSPSGDTEEAEALIRALAAEVRELRRDRARLEDSIARALLMASGRWSEWGTRAEATGEILDAAMGGGEGEA